VVRGYPVLHILTERQLQPHPLPLFARIAGTSVIEPADPLGA
jgi:hypothetical protein